MADLVPQEASAGRSLAALPRPVPGDTGSVLERVRAFADQPAIQRSLPLIGLVGLIALAAFAWFTFAQGPQRDLFRGLSDADKAAVAESLSASGIRYDVDRSGTLTVADSDYHQARMLLAQQGLPKSAPDGDAMISSLPMGASRAVEGERLRGAREADLARTIEAIDAVQSARVHLAMQQPSVFLRDEAKSAASVMLKLNSGRTLADNQVAAIAHLVASSVPGLSPDEVSIVDQSGRLLSGAGGDPATRASERQIDLQQKSEARYLQALTTLLTPLVGPGNFTAEVHADLDFAEVQATRESYPKDLATIRAEQGAWTKEGGPDGPNAVGGIPGAISNAPPPATQVAAAPGGTLTPPIPGAPDATAAGGATGERGRTTENYERTFELGREVSVTKSPVGTVRRLSVAVALKEPEKGRRTGAELAQIENLIKGAVGFDATRGDQIAVSSRKFAPVDDSSAPAFYEQSWVPLLVRNLSALLIALVLVFGLARPLLAKRAKFAEERGSLKGDARSQIGREMAAAIATEARADPTRTVTLDMIESAPGYTARAELIRNFVRQDPARAALVVRDLIRSNAPEGANNG
jgi:flagellar M-ring protein FliF